MSSVRYGQSGGGGVPSRAPQGGRGGGRPPRSSGGRGRSDDTVANHWPGYLEGGYFDEAGDLRVEYVSREKVEPLAKLMREGPGRLTNSQLRRFFQHARRIETRLRNHPDSWGALRKDVAFLDAAAQDAYGKDNPKIPSLFFDFIKRNVAATHSARDFLDGFLPHFEALVGFGALHLRN